MLMKHVHVYKHGKEEVDRFEPGEFDKFCVLLHHNLTSSVYML